MEAAMSVTVTGIIANAVSLFGDLKAVVGFLLGLAFLGGIVALIIGRG